MIDTIIAGLLHGNVYALVAVGVSLIFGVTNVVNFAQGSILGFGAMLGWWFMGVLEWPWWLSIIAVGACSAIIGWIVNVTAVRPLIKAPPIAALLATFASSMILDNLSQVLFSTETRPYPEPLATDNFQLSGVRLGTSDFLAFGFTLVAMIALTFYLRFGKNGRALRAIASDQEAAQQMGVPVVGIQTLSFVVAAVLGGVGGVFFGMYSGVVTPTSATFTGIVGFVAAAVGGLGSIVGAVAGGFIIGLLEALGTYQFGGGFRDIFIFGLFLVILLIRPFGLFGSHRAVVSEPMTGTFLGLGKSIHIPHFGWVILAIIAFAFPFVAGPVGSSVGSQVAIYAIIAIPLTLLCGSAGQVSIGQAAPIAIGAYTSAILTTHLDLPFLIGLLAAGISAMAIATLLTLPIWRLNGHYVAMATMALAYVVLGIIQNWDSVTRGAYGITGIPTPEIFGVRFATPLAHYLIDFVILAAVLWAVSRIHNSHLGHVIAGVGADEIASRSLGIYARDYKALAYAVSAFCAGLAGALLAHQYNYIDPTVFPVQMSVLALTIVVLGGINSPFGAVLGALLLVGVPEVLRVADDLRIILYGVIMILIIRFRPEGLWMRKAS